MAWGMGTPRVLDEIRMMAASIPIRK